MEKINKAVLAIGGVTIAALGICMGIAKAKPAEYSLEWIKKLTDKDWEIEREIIRKNSNSSQYDEAAKIQFKNILSLFDKVKSERDWAGLTPQGPAYHREHGFNLYKP